MKIAQVKAIQVPVGEEEKVNELLAEGWLVYSHSLIPSGEILWVLIKPEKEDE